MGSTCNSFRIKQKSRTLICAGFICCAIIIIVLIIALSIAHGSGSKTESDVKGFKTVFGVYPHAAVAADTKICSDVGKDILARHGGKVLDAGIATLFCTSVLSMQHGGIGGGSFAVIYDKNHGVNAVDFREVAPAAATIDMFSKPEDRIKSKLGGLAIAVPGEVKGTLEMHRKYGTVPWKTLLAPSIKLLQDGFPLQWITIHAIETKGMDTLKERPGFEVFFDENKNIKPEGSIIKLPRLAKTFEAIAEDPDSFYSGSLARDIVADITDAGGIVQLEDLGNYKALFKEPTEMPLWGNLTVYSIPAPGSGPVLSYILSILSGYKMGPESIATDEDKILTYHRIVEAMKFAYAKRSSLGDEQFLNTFEVIDKLMARSFGEETRKLITDDKTHGLGFYGADFYNEENAGTAHISIVDGDGNAFSATSTVNYYFGSLVVGNRTGIFFNNEMDDFSTPNVKNFYGLAPSKANFIQPGKRPMSSMCPAIVWDKEKQRVVLVTGAAGGSRITTATALDIINNMWLNMSVPESLDQPRFHHQLLPMAIQTEKNFPSAIKEGLEKKGHEVEERGRSVVQTVRVFDDGSLQAGSDFRRRGSPSGF